MRQQAEKAYHQNAEDRIRISKSLEDRIRCETSRVGSSPPYNITAMYLLRLSNSNLGKNPIILSPSPLSAVARWPPALLCLLRANAQLLPCHPPRAGPAAAPYCCCPLPLSLCAVCPLYDEGCNWGGSLHHIKMQSNKPTVYARLHPVPHAATHEVWLFVLQSAVGRPYWSSSFSLTRCCSSSTRNRQQPTGRVGWQEHCVTTQGWSRTTRLGQAWRWCELAITVYA